MNREEAINTVRNIYQTDKEKEALGVLIPELRESEDERINKFLRHTFTTQYLCKDKTGKWHGEPVTNILTYLEKQKPVVTHGETYRVDTLGTQQVIAGKMPQKPELVQQPPITYTYNSNASRDERLKAALLALLNSDLLKVKEGGYFTKQDLIEWVERIPTDKPAENDCQFIDEKFMETAFWKQYVKDSIIPGNKPTQQDIDFLLPQAKNLFALATKDMCNGCKDWSRGYNAGLANAEKAKREKSVIITKQEYDSHSIVTRDAVSVKPAEWSESDTLMCNASLELLRSHPNLISSHGINKSSVIRWLQSFRPQKQGFIDDICSKAGISIPYLDGNQWCILKGDNIQAGVVGFGDTKEDALANFIKEVSIPQQWSEEDKTHLNWIIECLGSWKYQVPEFADQYQSAIDFLKSLRPGWKPSEEQMNALNFAITYLMHESSYKNPTELRELYEQLKKLM